MVLPEATLLEQQRALLSKGRLSRSEVQELTNINQALRNSYDYSYAEAPNVKMSGGKLIAKKGIGTVSGRYGYGVATPGSYVSKEAQATGYEITPDAVPFDEQVAQINAQNQQSTPQEQTPNFSFQGLNAVASYQGGGAIYQDRAGQQYTTRQSSVGSNINRFDIQPYRPPQQKVKFENLRALEKFKFTNKLIAEGTGGRNIVKAVNYYEGQTYAYDEAVVLDGDSVPRTRYGTISNRPDVNLYASLKTLATDVAFTYPKINAKVYGQSYAYKGLKFTTDFAFSSGSYVTQGIPVVRDVYASVRNVAQPFVNTAIANPVYTYVAVRGPKILGTRAYAVLDYADVGQSVITEATEGYATGGIPGALKGGTGAYLGERLSDKTAFFAGSPSIRSPVYSLTTKGQPTPMVLSELSTNKYQVLMQYKPQYIKGLTTYKEVEGVGVLRLKTRTTKRPLESDADGLYHPTTEPPLPATVVYSKTLFRRTPSRWGKRGQLSMSSLTGGTSSGSFQGTGVGNENFQDTITRPGPEIVSITKTRSSPLKDIQPRTMPRALVTQRAISPNVALSLSQTPNSARALTYNLNVSKNLALPNTNARTISQIMSQSLPVTNTQTQTQSQTQSQSISATISQSFARSQTQTQTLTQTQTRTQTRTPTLTRTKFRKVDNILKKAKFNIPKGRNRGYAYKTSVFAYTNRIRGKKSRIGTLSGLGIRPQ